MYTNTHSTCTNKHRLFYFKVQRIIYFLMTPIVSTRCLEDKSHYIIDFILLEIPVQFSMHNS